MVYRFPMDNRCPNLHFARTRLNEVASANTIASSLICQAKSYSTMKVNHTFKLLISSKYAFWRYVFGSYPQAITPKEQSISRFNQQFARIDTPWGRGRQR